MWLKQNSAYINNTTSFYHTVYNNKNNLYQFTKQSLNFFKCGCIKVKVGHHTPHEKLEHHTLNEKCYLKRLLVIVKSSSILLCSVTRVVSS